MALNSPEVQLIAENYSIGAAASGTLNIIADGGTEGVELWVRCTAFSGANTIVFTPNCSYTNDFSTSDRYVANATTVTVAGTGIQNGVLAAPWGRYIQIAFAAGAGTSGTVDVYIVRR